MLVGTEGVPITPMTSTASELLMLAVLAGGGICWVGRGGTPLDIVRHGPRSARLTEPQPDR